jgi:glycosyltransferase involved in cell wall biosynthesis
MDKLISVVIPTRERCETLRFTLATVAAQEFADLQILVSDNASEDNTREVVSGFEDPRIQYVRAPHRMSMCDHYNFALGHAIGKYLIIIGDDDAIMPGALRKFAEVAAARPSKVYQWRPHGYVWPIRDRPPQLHLFPQPPAIHEIKLRQRVESSLEWGVWGWGDLPQLYHSAVAREIADEIRARTGRVFHSMGPDVFSAFAIPVFSDTALFLNTPVSCVGASSKSNSGGGVVNDFTNWAQFVREYDGYQLHPKLRPAIPRESLVRNDAFIIPDAALIAMDLFPEYYRGIRFDYSAMWAFMQRSRKTESIRALVRRARVLEKAHGFSVSRFLFYRCGVHFADQLRNTGMRLLLGRHFGGQFARIDDPSCTEISQAVNVLARLEKSNRTDPSLRSGRSRTFIPSAP